MIAWTHHVQVGEHDRHSVTPDAAMNTVCPQNTHSTPVNWSTECMWTTAEGSLPAHHTSVRCTHRSKVLLGHKHDGGHVFNILQISGDGICCLVYIKVSLQISVGDYVIGILGDTLPLSVFLQINIWWQLNTSLSYYSKYRSMFGKLKRQGRESRFIEWVI